MARILHRFTYGVSDTAESSCAPCRDGGVWRLKMGAPELVGKRHHDWKPSRENGCTWDGEDPRDPVVHVVVLNPSLWSKPVLLTDVFVHEVFHVIDHAERCRGTRGWSRAIPHGIISRLASAFAKFLHENDLEIVKRKRVVVEVHPFLEAPK